MQFSVAGNPYQTLGVAVPSRLAEPRLAHRDDANKHDLSQMRFAVKDVYLLQGLKTSLCNKDYYRLYPAAKATATVVQRLVDAGGQIVGLTKLSSMIAREEPLEAVDFQTAFNPRGDGYQSPAGSSSGSAAAVASYDWLDFALGTDTSGSGRRPALVNGVYQFRPSHSDDFLDGLVPTFHRFDSPCVFGRSLTILESVLEVWFGRKEMSLVSCGQPLNVIYPTDQFLDMDSDQTRLLKDFLADMTTHLGARVNEISIHEKWREEPPEGVSEDLAEFLKGVIVRAYYYSFYHTMGGFRDGFPKKYGRSPYVIPFVRERWDAGASVTNEEHEAAVRKLDVYRAWLLQHIFQPKSTLMVLPIAKVEPNYRDIMAHSPAILPDTDQLYLPPILGSPDIVIPIGEVEYHSRITGNPDFLPVAINLVAAPGEDFRLLAVARETLKRSRRMELIRTGARISDKRRQSFLG